jgi:adenylate cyclase
MWFLAILGNAYSLAGDYDLAIDTFKKAIKREPDSVLPRVGLTSTLSRSGMVAEAKSAAEEVLRFEPQFSVTRWTKGHPFKDLTELEQLRKNLLDAGLPD